MVIRRNAGALVALVAFSQLALTGCGLSRWWGETSRQVGISQAESRGPDCDELGKIFTSEESESERVLDCYTAKVDDVWKQVEGKEKESLSEDEIRTLVRKGIVTLPGNSEMTLNRIFTAKRLLGFQGPVTRAQLNDWVEWAKRNRSLARDLFQKFTREELFFSYADFEAGANLVASALDKMNWSMDSHDFSYTLMTTMDIHDRDIRGAFTPAAEVGINFLNMICPTFRERDVWSTSDLASCVRLMSRHFRSGGAWFEFLLNRTHDMSLGQMVAIKQALDNLDKSVEGWFRQPNLTPVYPSRWTELARRMGAKPPENFFDSLRVLRRFNSRTNEETIYPEAMIRFYEIAAQTQRHILGGITHYINAVKRGECVDPKTTYWTDCALKDHERASRESDPINLALKVKNLNHGQKSAPLNGRQFSRIMLFHKVAAQIIIAFHDDRDPNFITTDLGDDNDKLVQLITIGVTSAETIEQFFGNMRKKLQHLPITENDSFLHRHWNIAGFARLIAMSSDILVKRSNNERDILSSLLANLIYISPSSVALDQLAVTAILTTIDALPQYRDSYLAPAGALPATELSMVNLYNVRIKRERETQEWMVHRDSLMRNLPAVLKTSFPRTYEACMRFGFERSCGVALDKILSQPKPGSEYIHASDLDIITIIGIGMEGVIDACDRDGDSRLSINFFDGADELDCGFDLTQGIVRRLIDSRILEMSDGERSKAAAILGFVNSTSVTRVMGKIAMARGTTEGMALRMPLFWRYDHATLGSMFGLVADIADPDRARAAR